jgi:hypothetical protein
LRSPAGAAAVAAGAAAGAAGATAFVTAACVADATFETVDAVLNAAALITYNCHV